MNELCVPLPVLEENQVAELEVTIGDKKERYNFRVESFKWLRDEKASLDSQLDFTTKRIEKLKSSIEGYDKTWEIIQIYTPSPGANFIQVLFRKKQV
ncbi:MAG: hypothetical protein HOK35_01765 [Cytophagia bacterium]|jgi:hypothetical protein|nr:hypothetical protein [Cytophagia bacterium]